MCRIAYAVDAERLREMWADANYTQAEVAREFRLTRRQLEDAVERHALGARAPIGRTNSMGDAESPADEMASGDSLAFSPWVAARIKELRIGMPA